MKKIISIFVTICLLSSCANPKLTNWDRGRYTYYDHNGYSCKKNMHDKKSTTPRPLNHPVIDVSVAAVPVEIQVRAKKETKRFTDYSEKVQLALLRKLTDDAAKNKVLIDALKADYSEPEIVKEDSKKDYTEIKLRLYFSNVKKYYKDARLIHPNTRLAFLNTFVKIDDNSNMTFQSVDKIENEFESIDMGKLERSQDVNFNSKLSGDITAKIIDDKTEDGTNTSVSSNGTKKYDEDGNEIESSGNTTTNDSKTKRNTKKEFGKGVKADATLDLKSNIKEAVNVKLNRLKTGFSLNKKSLTVSQQGSLLRDINDVTIVTTTMQYNNNAKKSENVIEFSDLFNKDGRTNPVTEIKFKRTNIKYYPCSSDKVTDEKITFSYQGAIRAPKNLKRGKNILEYDDKVNYFAFDSYCQKDIDCKGNEIVKHDTLEVSKYTFCKQVYRIIAINLKTKEKSELIISINADTYVPNMEGKSAYDFLSWIQAVGGSKVGIYDKTSLIKFFTKDSDVEKFNPNDYQFELEDIDKSKATK